MLHARTDAILRYSRAVYLYYCLLLRNSRHYKIQKRISKLTSTRLVAPNNTPTPHIAREQERNLQNSFISLFPNPTEQANARRLQVQRHFRLFCLRIVKLERREKASLFPFGQLGLGRCLRDAPVVTCNLVSLANRRLHSKIRSGCR